KLDDFATEVSRRALLTPSRRIPDEGDQPGDLLPDQVARRGRAVEQRRAREGALAQGLHLPELALQRVLWVRGNEPVGNALHRMIPSGEAVPRRIGRSTGFLDRPRRSCDAGPYRVPDA